jgi:hypothetical protein
MAELCRRYGISRQTGYEVLADYAKFGPAGLVDGSDRPHTRPHAMPAPDVALILQLQQRYTWGARKVRRLLAQRLPATDDRDGASDPGPARAGEAPSGEPAPAASGAAAGGDGSAERRGTPDQAAGAGRAAGRRCNSCIPPAGRVGITEGKCHHQLITECHLSSEMLTLRLLWLVMGALYPAEDC